MVWIKRPEVVIFYIMLLVHHTEESFLTNTTQRSFIPRTWKIMYVTMPIMMVVTNDYKFDRTLLPEADALKAYQDICGRRKNKMVCNNTLNGKTQQLSGWSCIGCPPCSCSDDCDSYGTCCPDRAIIEAKLTTEKSKTRVPLSSMMTCRNESSKHCESVSITEPNNPVKVIMVSRCPNKYPNNTNRHKCEGADDVTDMMKSFQVSSLINKYTYRNIYCSRCHDIADTEVKYWKPNINCKNASAVLGVRSQSELWRVVVESKDCCGTSSTPPHGVLKTPCWWSQDVVDRCNVTGKWSVYDKYIEQMCSYPLVAVVKNKNGLTYKNLYCASCNGILLKRSLGSDCINHGVTQGTFSYAALIDFSPRKAIEEPKKVDGFKAKSDISETCQHDEIRNPLTGECSSIQCDDRFLYNVLTESCKMVFHDVRGLGYKIVVRLVPKTLNMTFSPNMIAYNLFGTVEMFLSKFFNYLIEPMIMVMEVNDTRARVTKNSPMNITAINVSISLRSNSFDNYTEYEKYLNQLFFNDCKIYVGGIEGWKPCYATTINTCDGHWFSEAKRKVPGLYFELRRRRAFRCGGSVCSTTDYINYKQTMSCPFLKFNLSELTFSTHRSSVDIIIGNYTLKGVAGTDYIICKNTVKICLSNIKNATLSIQTDVKQTRPVKKRTIASDKALIIVSIIATTVSLICLMLTFITYCLFKELRTLPGMNTMALIANLFFAQIFFQMGIKPTGSESICRFLGIAIHYLWMSSFAWMGVCAFHMFAVFRNVLNYTSKEYGNSRFIAYFVCGNILSAAIPLTCVLYHRLSENEDDFGYGGWICFLNSAEDIGYFFAIPLGFILFINATYFTLTVLSLRKLPDMTSSSNRHNRGHMCVYIKMSALLGLTWILGLVAAAVNSIVLWYIFIIINGSQGVFIFLAYCAKRRILKYYGNIFLASESSPSSKQTNSSNITENEKKSAISVVDASNNAVVYADLKFVD